MKADEVMTVDLFDEDTDDEDVIPLRDENATLILQESSNGNDDEGNLEGQSILW